MSKVTGCGLLKYGAPFIESIVALFSSDNLCLSKATSKYLAEIHRNRDQKIIQHITVNDNEQLNACAYK